MGYRIAFCGAHIMAAPKDLPGDVRSKLDAALKAAIGSDPVQTFIELRRAVLAVASRLVAAGAFSIWL